MFLPNNAKGIAVDPAQLTMLHHPQQIRTSSLLHKVNYNSQYMDVRNAKVSQLENGRLGSRNCPRRQISGLSIYQLKNKRHGGASPVPAPNQNPQAPPPKQQLAQVSGGNAVPLALLGTQGLLRNARSRASDGIDGKQLRIVNRRPVQS